MRGVQPGLATAPAETGHAQPVHIAPVGCRPLHRGVEVAHHLRVGHLRNHLRDQLGHLAIALGIALAHEQLGRNGQVAGTGETPRGVGNVFMHAKDLGQHQHHGQTGLAGGRGTVGRHGKALDVDHHLARGQAIGRGLDRRLRHQRHRRRGIAHAQRGLERGAARGTAFGRFAGQQGREVLGQGFIEHGSSPVVVENSADRAAASKFNGLFPSSDPRPPRPAAAPSVAPRRP